MTAWLLGAYAATALASFYAMARLSDAWPPKGRDLYDRGMWVALLLSLMWPATLLVAGAFYVVLLIAAHLDRAGEPR